MFKKLLISIIFAGMLLSQSSFVFAESTNSDASDSGKYVFQGHAEIDDNAEQNNKIFTGDTSVVKKGTVLKMTVSQVLSTGYNQKDDEFFAEIVNDLDGLGGVAIPSGTIAHGKITQMEGSKRMGRDAYVTLNFDYLVTPDGREIPIEASMTTKRSPVASVAKVALEDTAYTAAGGVMGGLLAVKYLGVGTAIASHGYTVAGGAGIGALVGAGISLSRKGQDVLIAPGDEINVKIGGALQLPTISNKALRDDEKSYDGLDVKIANINVEKDPFGEPNTITLSLVVVNKTPKTFSSFDMALINDYNAVYYPSPFGDTELWFTKIQPGNRVAGKLSFSVDNPKRKFWLVFYDSRTRKPLARISLNNARKDIKDEQKKSKNKKV